MTKRHKIMLGKTLTDRSPAHLAKLRRANGAPRAGNGAYHNLHPELGRFWDEKRSDLACADCACYYTVREWTSHDGTRTDFKHYCPSCARIIWVEGKRP